MLRYGEDFKALDSERYHQGIKLSQRYSPPQFVESTVMISVSTTLLVYS